MFIIKWRRIMPLSLQVVTGLRRYETIEEAQKQAAIFQTYFPFNRYYVEREMVQ